MSIRPLVLTGSLAVAAAVPVAVNALTVDLAATALGGGQWRYSYTLHNATFNSYEGFTIYFEYDLYGALSNPATANADWDLLTVNPDSANSLDGFLDALAVSNNAGLTEAFSVEFSWLGPGAPLGGQFFETYACVGLGPDPCETIAITGQGYTAGVNPVPLPASGALLAASLLGLAMHRRGRR